MGALGCSECNKQEANRYTDEAYAWEVATMRVCLHVLFSSFAMPVVVFRPTQRLDEFAVVGFERLGLVSFAFVDAFALFCVCIFVTAGPSKQRVEQGNLYGLCFAISPEPSCEPRPHISEAYQLIGRIDEARSVPENGCFWLV